MLCSHTPQERIKVIFYTETKKGFENPSCYYYYSFLKKTEPEKIKKMQKLKEMINI